MASLQNLDEITSTNKQVLVVTVRAQNNLLQKLFINN